jgi:ATP citrate (pro-S)-lyase
VSTRFVYPAPKVAQVSWDPETNTITPDTQLPSWVFTTKLVAKPDQLIKRRGKAGLLALNKTWDEAKEWIAARAGKPQKASSSLGFFMFIAFCIWHRGSGWNKAETMHLYRNIVSEA